MRQNSTKSFPRILGRSKEKPGGLFHKTQTDLEKKKYATNILEPTRKEIENSKY